ncbi:MAG: hypothetical protein Q4B42_06720, partial [Oscillospiraceae bacterium]|nr:hypothetical protein [Oscillospiraceae bacterium]
AFIVIFVFICTLAFTLAGLLARAEALEAEGSYKAAYGVFDKLSFIDRAERGRGRCILEMGGAAARSGDCETLSSLYALAAGTPLEAELTSEVLEYAGTFASSGDYEEAWLLCEALEGSKEAQAAAGGYVEAYYALLAAEYESSGAVSEDFGLPMFEGYLEADKYAAVHRLQNGDWAENYEENLELLYSLGDFLNLRESGFMNWRVYSHNYSNEEGYYFRTDAYGDWDYNLPHYYYGGYYGLYAKLEGNTFLTGSDEADFWREQFVFYLSELDEVLDVYCVATGETIRLYRD